MLIALLAVLGVDLIVVAGVAAVVVSRRAWVSRQAGAFKGAVRVTGGEVAGFGPRWNELAAAGGLAGEVRPAAAGDKVRRLGHGPVIVPVTAGGARIEVAAPADKRDRALGPSAGPARADPGGGQSRAVDPARRPR
jgi:hypothetical protein